MQETQEIWVGSLDQVDPLKEEMATHSSVLACKIPETEEPGRQICRNSFGSTFLSENYERGLTSIFWRPVGAQATFIDFAAALKGVPMSPNNTEHPLTLGTPWLRLPFGQNVSKCEPCCKPYQALKVNYLESSPHPEGELILNWILFVLLQNKPLKNNEQMENRVSFIDCDVSS